MITYRPELDALRFFAFLLVFYDHTCASIAGDMASRGTAQAIIASAAFAGAWGVDLFFLLSAYLITSLLIREREKSGNIDIPAFYRRRVLRIWPLYFAFVFFCYGLQFVTPTDFPTPALLAFLFLSGNWYFGLAQFTSPVGILWSVSVEEQFYLLWPLALRRLSYNGMLVAAGAMIVVASCARYILLSAELNNFAIWCNTFARLDPIAIGIIAAVVLRTRVPAFSPRARAALFLLGIGLLLIGGITFEATKERILPIANGMIGYPCGSIGALFIFVSFLGANIKNGIVTYLGKISYGLYVFHLFALDFAKVELIHYLGWCPFWARALIAFPITVAMAAASYRWLETPFLNLKRRFVRAQLGPFPIEST